MAIRPVPDGGSRASASPAYERVPPHNVEAEESVLGSMLLSKDAIAEVLELLREDDFYRPAHRTVFRSVLELYGHGDAVDAVTVQEELRRNGSLADIGGAPFLHTLVASVPTAANAGYYARIVKEAGVLRRLIDVGTQIVQLGFETPRTPSAPSTSPSPSSTRSPRAGSPRTTTPSATSSPAPSKPSNASTKNTARSPASPPASPTSTA